jgi:hypothetical protein
MLFVFLTTGTAQNLGYEMVGFGFAGEVAGLVMTHRPLWFFDTNVKEDSDDV